jgi:hypothetical protein
MKRTICDWCKTPFDALRSDAKYCSSSHRAQAAKARGQSRNKAQSSPAGRRSTAMTSALTRAVRKLPRAPHDPGVVALARLYARALDADPDLLPKLGPQYLAVLTALGMTQVKGHRQASPAEIDLTPLAGGQDTPARAGKLDELRAKRAAREQ